MPLERNKKYTLTARDFSSLRRVLSVQSLRDVNLYLDCIPDVQNCYYSFIQSSNNNYNKFVVENFVSSRSKGGNSRHNLGYCHRIEIDSLSDFDIVEFIMKFKRSPARFFDIVCNSDKKWSEIKTECEQFTTSRKDYRFTLRRFTDRWKLLEVVEYNLWKVE